ncbi:MAG: hypothetical protein HZA53_18340 [Planctomycetes bacterium]|nr:hypothetical protein [Planctomycetota bacterium]
MSSQIIKHTLVKLGAPAPTRGSSASKDRQHGRKDARVIQVDGEARAIEITCACGEKTVVELVFDAQRTHDGGTKP